MATGDPLKRTGFKQTFQSDFTKPVEQTGWTTFYAQMDPTGGWHGRALPGENELYIDEAYCGVSPFTYQNGMLVIHAKPATAAQIASITGLNQTRNFISGIITTIKSFSQAYGYFEVYCTVPRAQGAWPAFWLLPVTKTTANEGRLPEIDVFEYHQGKQANGVDISGQMIITLHEGDNTGETATSNLHQNPPVITPMAQHVYGVLWEPGKLTFYLDDKEVWSCPTSASDPHYMILNYAIDARYPNPQADQFLITNVRAFQIPQA